jgi:hypothetical protein
MRTAALCLFPQKKQEFPEAIRGTPVWKCCAIRRIGETGCRRNVASTGECGVPREKGQRYRNFCDEVRRTTRWRDVSELT